LQSLHEQQVASYKQQATAAIKAWADSFPLEPMEETDTQKAFVDRCVTAVAKAAQTSMPKWKLDGAASIATETVRELAMANYQKYNPSTSPNDINVKKTNPASSHATDEEHCGEDGMEEEDVDHSAEGDDDDEDGDDDDEDEGQEPGAVNGVEASSFGQNAGTSVANKKSKNKKKRANNGKQTIAKKKASSNAKAGIRNRGGRGGSRGGRGGGRGGRPGNHNRSNSRDS
jgi:hypothetical protein